MLQLFAGAPSLRYLAEMSDSIPGVEGQWHRIYLHLQSLLGQLKVQQNKQAEKNVWGKRSEWVDYSGPMPRGAVEGITLMDHPANPGHPNPYHVRDDGWMGATTTFAEPHIIDQDHPLTLRYGLWVHGGLPSATEINAQFEAFAKIEPPPTKGK